MQPVHMTWSPVDLERYPFGLTPVVWLVCLVLFLLVTDLECYPFGLTLAFVICFVGFGIFVLFCLFVFVLVEVYFNFVSVVLCLYCYCLFACLFLTTGLYLLIFHTSHVCVCGYECFYLFLYSLLSHDFIFSTPAGVVLSVCFFSFISFFFFSSSSSSSPFSVCVSKVIFAHLLHVVFNTSHVFVYNHECFCVAFMTTTTMIILVWFYNDRSSGWARSSYVL